MSSEEAVLSFDIVIDAKLSAGTKKTLEELKAAEEPTESKAAVTDEEEEETITETEAAERLEEFIKTTDREGMKTLSSFAKNPTSMVENQLLKVLGRAGVYGALAAAIVSARRICQIIPTPEEIAITIYMKSDIHAAGT